MSLFSTGAPVRYSDYDRSKPTPPPLLGQHTESVLQSMLELNTGAIETLKKSNVIA